MENFLTIGITICTRKFLFCLGDQRIGNTSARTQYISIDAPHERKTTTR